MKIFSKSIFLILLFINSSVNSSDSKINGDKTKNRLLIDRPISMEFAWIPSGSLVIGDHSSTGQNDEQPLMKIAINGFWLQTTEVTLDAYALLVQQNAYVSEKGCWVHDSEWVLRPNLDWKNPGFAQDGNHPVTCISWDDTQAFIKWLNRNSDYQFRLPTEAEWEYATRAGTNTIYFFGNEPQQLCQYANAADLSALADYPGFAVNACDDGYARTSPVGIFKPNPNGLFDLYGNVWEWIEDCWTPNYENIPLDASANMSGKCERRVFRGGGYGDIPHFARSTLRNRGYPYDKKDDIGFRLVIIKN